MFLSKLWSTRLKPLLPNVAAIFRYISAGREIRSAIEFHIEGLRKAGYEIPAASSSVDYVEVAA